MATKKDNEAFRASCTHIRVIFRPVGSNAEGWRPVWVCEQCCAEFVPESQVNMAFRAADLRGAQLLMVGSQLADDPKMDHRDRADPRWTPTLHEAWVQREENKRLLSSVDGYRRDIDNCLAELKHKNQVLRDRDIEHSKVCSERDEARSLVSKLEPCQECFNRFDTPRCNTECDKCPYKPYGPKKDRVKP